MRHWKYILLSLPIILLFTGLLLNQEQFFVVGIGLTAVVAGAIFKVLSIKSRGILIVFGLITVLFGWFLAPIIY